MASSFPGRSAAWPDDSQPASFSATVDQALKDQLTEDLTTQRTILRSLLDLPDTYSEQSDEVVAARAEIRQLSEQLAELRKKSRATSTSGHGTRNTQDNHHFQHTLAPIMSNPQDSSGGQASTTRKRSFGSSFRHPDQLNPPVKSRSRHASPNPGHVADDFGHQNPWAGVIDLTGDDDEFIQDRIRAQREAENHYRQSKMEADRDEAFARQISQSHSSASTPNFSASTTPTSTSSGFSANAQPMLSGNNSHQQSLRSTVPLPSFRSNVRPGPNPPTTLTERPLIPSARTLADNTNDGFGGGLPSMPGAYVDTDSDNEPSDGQAPSLYQHAPAYLAQQSLPNPRQLHTPQQQLHPQRQLPVPSFRPASRIPPAEMARQTVMGSSGAPLNGMVSQGSSLASYQQQYQQLTNNAAMHGHTQPSYFGYQPFPTTYASHASRPLSDIIGRVNGYNFNDMVDGTGNPLDARVANFVRAAVNDPRKTEEELKALLSNIRPDMDIPEEERGETPDALTYPLYPHQQLALKWMSDMEEGSNKGGILADDMGLGKTVSSLALMVARPSTTEVKTNLIIGPVALIKQWETEIKRKLKPDQQFKVFLHHQKKMEYEDLKKFDVVLTTYGSVAGMWRRYNQHTSERDCEGYNPAEDLLLAQLCPLIHPRSVFYRIILDEAQCIKNKDTQVSQAVIKINATYRWCLTGTPMMNGIKELYPLIRFLRIKPFDNFTEFQKAFKVLEPRGNSGSDLNRNQAMKQVQALLKATMLRRMKTSKIDGKPILTLPDKTENTEYVTFSDDEQRFYNALQSSSQVLFSKYLRTNTVGKNYTNILVLLLRLRQACCHPHLTEFEEAAARGAPTSPTQDMLDSAKNMDVTTAERIKNYEEFECPICYDPVPNPTLLLPCGHHVCTECFASLSDNTAQNSIRSGNERGVGQLSCPVCRGAVNPAKVINYTAFQQVHMPDKVKAEDEETAQVGTDAGVVGDSEDSEDSSSDESDWDSDSDSAGSLVDFVVDDLEAASAGPSSTGDDTEGSLDAEHATAAARAKKKTNRKGKKSKANKSKKDEKGKGKAKAEAATPSELSALRKHATRNKKARRQYMHFLRDNWQDSTKVSKVLELLLQIQETNEKTIIFSQWTALLDLIETQIKYKLHLKYQRYTGDMTRNQRDAAVREFSDNPRTTILLVSLRAGNSGLNLTVASRVIICDPCWNPFIEMQAVDRAHRIGQQREVQVHRVLTQETVEDRIMELQEKKRKLVDSALDEGQAKNLAQLSTGELSYLFGVGSGR